jgi:hypothetical protein
MNLLYIVGSFPPEKCGVGDYSKKLIDQLSKKRYLNITIVTTRNKFLKRDESTGNLKEIMNDWSLIEYFKIKKYIKKADVIHLQYPSVNFKNGMLPWCLPIILKIFHRKIKLIITYHGYFNVKLLHSLKALPSLFFVDRAICVVPDHFEKIFSFFKILLNKEKFTYIENVSNIPKSISNMDEIDNIKKLYLNNKEYLVVFFGFASKVKGLEQIFTIVNHINTSIVLVCELNRSDLYQLKLLEKIKQFGNKISITITGYLDENKIADILSSADAAIFPFKTGGGTWNTSINAALLQNTFVLTTSEKSYGYDQSKNIYYAKVDDTNEMSKALYEHIGIKAKNCLKTRNWDDVTKEHINVYNL